MGALITCGVLLVLAVLPLGIWVRYDSDGALVRLVCGPVKITVFPRTKKEKKEKTGTEKKQDKKAVKKNKEESLPKPPQPPKEEKPKEEAKKGGSLMDFLPLVKTALDFLGDFRKKLRLDELYLRLILASSDPCDLAVNYGKTWAAVGGLMPVLERCFVIKKRDVEVECDFSAPDTLVIARVQITMTLGRLVGLIVVYAVRLLKDFLNIRNKRKGGADK